MSETTQDSAYTPPGTHGNSEPEATRSGMTIDGLAIPIAVEAEGGAAVEAYVALRRAPTAPIIDAVADDTSGDDA